MTVKQKKQLDEKVQTGGGATGVAHTADPVDKRATLPASHLNNGEGMNKLADITPGQSEQDTDPANNVKTTTDAAASNKSSVSMKPSHAAASMKEDVDAMFAGTELSEEFKEKATLIYEAAINAAVDSIAKELEEQYNTKLSEETARVEAEMTEKVDQYMSYVVEQWMEENKVAIEASLKNEITESFIADLQALFEAHHISIPEDKYDVLEGMQQQVAELQQKLDSVMEDNMALTSKVNESVRKDIVDSVSEGLAATQVEKLVALSEGVEFDTAENYRKKLEIVKENYFPAEKAVGTKQNLLEEVSEENAAPVKQKASGPVSFYAEAISRSVKK